MGRHPGPLEGAVCDQRRADQARQATTASRSAPTSGASACALGDRVRVSRMRQPALGGCFQFNNLFTEQEWQRAATKSPACCSACLTPDRSARSGRLRVVTRSYWGVYFQDDWRVNSKFTLNYGLRLEHERARARSTTSRPSRSTGTSANPLDSFVPKAGTPLAGRTLQGRFDFRRRQRGADRAGQSTKPSCRRRESARPTRWIRGRSSAPATACSWAPWNYNTTQHGQIGFRAIDADSVSRPSASEVPIGMLDNPFPAALVTPIGSSLGLLTGVGGQVDFVDQNKTQPARSVSIRPTSSASWGSDGRHHRLHRRDRA